MKKTLIAMSVLLAAGSAAAQSSVTLYGLADTGLQYEKFKERDADGFARSVGTTKLSSGVVNGSRLGIRGVEDLGNSLKATFNYELGFKSNTGAFSTYGDNDSLTGFGRAATVGLSGNFGHIRLGRDTTAGDNLLGATSADGVSAIGTANRVLLLGHSNLVKDNLITDRLSGVHYSGSFGAVNVDAFYAPDQVSKNVEPTKTVKTNKAGYGVGVNYAQGPVLVGAAAQQLRNKVTENGAATTHRADTEWVVGGTYDFNVAKLYANYIQNTANYKLSGFKPRYSEANLGVTVPFGAASLIAEYSYNRYKENDSKARNSHDFMVGANYAFSKRTDVYTRVSRLNAPKNADTGLRKDSLTAVAVGLRHRF